VKRVFVIAEAGVNHNGDIELAKRLIDAACAAGADAVKFQTFTAERLVSKKAKKAQYQQETTDVSETQYAMLKRLELDADAHRTLMAYCKAKGIMFLSTPFDLESVDLLNAMGLEIFKIPSGEITNKPYLRKIGSLRKRVLLSTGMSTLGEVEAALDVLTESGTVRDAITVLHANTMYPTPMEDVNLNAMLTIRDAFKIAVGYSDHTLGIEVDIAAAALGATVIEKHFTLDRSMEGPDHQASLEPDELKAMVAAIRNIETATGSGIKAPSPSEMPNRTVARKSIVAGRAIKKGERIGEEDLDVKRPGGGISPMRWDEVVGRIAVRDYEAGEML
jgi:N,N'-diacetyllegionaminate synthase